MTGRPLIAYFVIRVHLRIALIGGRSCFAVVQDQDFASPRLALSMALVAAFLYLRGELDAIDAFFSGQAARLERRTAKPNPSQQATPGS